MRWRERGQAIPGKNGHRRALVVVVVVAVVVVIVVGVGVLVGFHGCDALLTV